MFLFQLQQVVRIAGGNESGTIIGRSEYANGAPPSYLVRYIASDGCAAEQWWTEDALAAA